MEGQQRPLWDNASRRQKSSKTNSALDAGRAAQRYERDLLLHPYPVFLHYFTITACLFCHTCTSFHLHCLSHAFLHVLFLMPCLLHCTGLLLPHASCPLLSSPHCTITCLPHTSLTLHTLPPFTVPSSCHHTACHTCLHYTLHTPAYLLPPTTPHTSLTLPPATPPACLPAHLPHLPLHTFLLSPQERERERRER